MERRRCGWCGAYEGTVDPTEPCIHAIDPATGDCLGPHQFPERRRAERRKGEDRRVTPWNFVHGHPLRRAFISDRRTTRETRR